MEALKKRNSLPRRQFMRAIQKQQEASGHNTASPKIRVGSMNVDPVFHAFVEDELLPQADIDSDCFWTGAEGLIRDLSPLNQRMLTIRDVLQKQIDDWHEQRRGETWDEKAHLDFLGDIGYLAPQGKPFSIGTTGVDPEIASIAGPQLVVPASNARFAINAANARWGSLFDAAYGSDVVSERAEDSAVSGYDPKRGKAVIDYAVRFLDRALPLRDASHADVVRYDVNIPMRYAECVAVLRDGRRVGLRNKRLFCGWTGYADRKSLLFRHQGLHIRIDVDPAHPIGKTAPGFTKDVLLESAITTILDCEDSVTAVDAEDKTNVYRNLLGLMSGSIEATFEKNGRQQTRRLKPGGSVHRDRR